jgi:hypothetical protein
VPNLGTFSCLGQEIPDPRGFWGIPRVWPGLAGFSVLDGSAGRFWVRPGSDPEVAIWSRSRLSASDWSESEGNFSAWVVLKLGGNIGLWKDEISTVPEWVDRGMDRIYGLG